MAASPTFKELVVHLHDQIRRPDGQRHTPETLAALMRGVAPRTVQAILQERDPLTNNNPRYHTIKEFIRVFKINPRYFFPESWTEEERKNWRDLTRWGIDPNRLMQP